MGDSYRHPLDVVNDLVRCVHPGFDNHVSFGTVLNVDYDAGLMQSYMDVEDLEGRVLNAIKEYGCDLTILGNYGNSAPSSEPVTSGHWDDISYDSQTDTTTFTDFSATFPPHAVNWWLQPDAARSTYLEIVSLSASQVVVEGDATGLAHGLIPQPGPPPLPDLIGTFYTIVWPAGVDPATGTLAHNNPCKTTSRLLFAGYYYMPPVAGTLVPPPGNSSSSYQQPAWQMASGKYRPTGPGIQLAAAAPPAGVYGQQPGGNHHGDYYCWNRVYAQKQGKFTTSDHAATPWRNLQDYAGENPLSRTDPSGLFGTWIRGLRELQRLTKLQPKPGFPTHNSITRGALADSTVPKCLHDMVVRGASDIDKPGFLWGHGGIAALHVDDTRFLMDTEEWISAVRMAGAYLQKNNASDCKCIATLAYLAGMAAHTIQDFYHHSDWFFGGGGDVRMGGSLAGLRRWDETAESAQRVRVGSGWRASGEANGKAESEARVGPWHHDPWGDLLEATDEIPLPPNGHTHLSYLWAAVGRVIGPHTTDFLNDVLGGIDTGCCCDGNVLGADHYQFNPGYGERAMERCFGPTAGPVIAKFTISLKPHPRGPEND